MVQRILLALDGSDHAAKALELAVTLAKATGSELRILYVASHQPLTQAEQRLAETEYSAEIGAFLGAAQLLPDSLERPAALGTLVHSSRDIGEAVRRVVGESILHRAATQAERDGVAKVTTMMETGDPADVIVNQAQAHKPDLVMLGSRGLSDVKGVLLGSVSHKVAHVASCSVVTVK